MEHQYIYRAVIERVVDGDTVIARLDMGLHCYHIESIRVYGVDAPELFTGPDRIAGMSAKEFTRSWVFSAQHSLWPFLFRTHKGVTFGRFVAEVIRIDTGASLGDALVAAGHAVRRF